MASLTTKATTPTLQVGPGLPASSAAKGMPGKTADYVYRIAALSAGIALLMTAV